MDGLPGEPEAGIRRRLLCQLWDARRPRDIRIIGDEFGIDEVTVDDIGIGIAEIELLQGWRAEAGTDGTPDIKIIGYFITGRDLLRGDKAKIRIILEPLGYVHQPGPR